MIFVLIAGTYTPFCAAGARRRPGHGHPVVVWAGALGGVVLKLAWIDAPPRWSRRSTWRWAGWRWPRPGPDRLDRRRRHGHGGLLGGVLYSAGAVVYARQRPDPVPAVFGYHEVFHLLVIVAAALQYAVIAFWVIPGAEMA